MVSALHICNVYYTSLQMGKFTKYKVLSFNNDTDLFVWQTSTQGMLPPSEMVFFVSIAPLTETGPHLPHKTN